ncbi:unnamed protein product [Soboliphyme baturini]|uniref:BRCT domain-containing protein n=1 Tax=Soboliphyme baturini TaxID=241478 RepID=A0A3P8FL60_9BILA|nr:unnamed protein product [Soboliphyme baturini]
MSGIVSEEVTTDYTVTPFLLSRSELIEKSSRSVTENWLCACHVWNRVVCIDDSAFYKSVCLESLPTILTDCVLCVSQLSSVERKMLKQLGLKCGAIVQDYLVRKTNLEKNLLATTHLILLKPEGEKYMAAVKWNIPCVTPSWLVETALAKQRIDPQLYAVVGGIDASTESGAAMAADSSRTSGKRISTTLSMRDASTSTASSNASWSRSFLDADKSFHPKWNISLLKNKGRRSSISEDQLGNKRFLVSEEYDEFIHRQLLGAVKCTEEAEACFSTPSTAADQRPNIAHVKNKAPFSPTKSLAKKAALDSVVIVVSRRLVDQQTKLHKIVTDLGGDYRWKLDSSCTHFVYQGKIRDSGKEYRMAKELALCIVHPDWLYDVDFESVDPGAYGYQCHNQSDERDQFGTGSAKQNQNFAVVWYVFCRGNFYVCFYGSLGTLQICE